MWLGKRKSVPRTIVMNAEIQNLLRCPCDPKVPVEKREDGFVCTRCEVIFPIREQIPCFLIHEATLPDGIRRIENLPCRKEQKAAN